MRARTTFPPWVQKSIEERGYSAKTSLKQDDEVLKGWTLNQRVTTCKCVVCNDKVTTPKISLKCTLCHNHICSNCLTEELAEADWFHQSARNQVENYCWHIFQTRLHPYFAHNKPEPRRRPEEERKAKEEKTQKKEGKEKQTKEKKKQKNTDKNKLAASTSEVSNIASAPHAVAIVEANNGSAVPSSSLTAINGNEAVSKGIKRKVAEEGDAENKGPVFSGGERFLLKWKKPKTANDIGLPGTSSSEPTSSKDSLEPGAGQETALDGIYAHLVALWKEKGKGEALE